MTVLSITQLGDEDTRLQTSHNDDTEKQCFEVLAQVIIWAMSNGDRSNILINCSAGMNRSATLMACLVISTIKGYPFNDAVDYLETIRQEASRAGNVVPRGYFLSSGGAYFRALFDSSSPLLSPSKKRRLALAASKAISSPIGPSYDMKQHAYILEILQHAKTRLHIGNLLAAKQQPGFDLVVDLSGKAKTDGIIKMAFHECKDAGTIISSL